MSGNIEASRYKVNSPSVTFEWMEGEVIAVNLINGHYFSIVDLAAPVFCALAEGATMDEISDALSGKLDSTDHLLNLAKFVSQLVEESLLVAAQKETPEVDSGEGDIESWLTLIRDADKGELVFQKYTDIEALLALDPVHEITSSGWPEKK